MKTNEELQKDVQDAIKWEPLLHAAEIGVIANDGIITLTGNVDSYPEKAEAEYAAKNVAGVLAVVEKINIDFKNWDSTSDADIAKEAVNAFNWNITIPKGQVKIKVENGWVTLEGSLTWNFQKNAAETTVRYLNGVKGISNNIKIKSETPDSLEEKAIKTALTRNWSMNDADINVHVVDTTVTLSGTVTSWYQKVEAGRIAWNAPGVEDVANDLVIEHAYVFPGE